MQKPINRYLADKSMDNIDHALGRPLDPLAETYRNFYATDGVLADEMAASPFWEEGKRGSGMRYFYVSKTGREALAAHLREIGDQHRAFVVRFDGHDRTVIATSRAKARYSYFLDITDCISMKFGDYCKRVSVRVVQ
jgi:hypothetical protein